jgi:hypothetical protein
MSVPYERDLPEVKHTGLFGAPHARRAAQIAGYDDALFVGRNGHHDRGDQVDRSRSRTASLRHA